jgi:hypothetical protein
MNRQAKKKSPRTTKAHIQKPLPTEMAAYVAGKVKTAEIARALGLSEATITARAKAAGLPLRGRGRWALSEPTERQREIITIALTVSGSEAAKRYAISKQRVSRLLKRWSAWIKQNFSAIEQKPKKDKICPVQIAKPLTDKPKLHVISFRVDETVRQNLQTRLKTPFFQDCRSENDVARGIVALYFSTHSA